MEKMTPEEKQAWRELRDAIRASAKGYWIEATVWEALVLRADRYGFNITDTCKALGLSVLDRATTGAVHLG